MTRPSGPAAVPPAGQEPGGLFDRPWDRLSALPRPVWLPVVTAAVGGREHRLDHARAWLAALDEGRLPDAADDFGDAAASAPLRAVVGELGLPGLCRGVGTLAEQVVRTLLWHLDRLVDLQPRLSRAEAVAQVRDEFREAWRVETAGTADDLRLLHDLADAASLRWDTVRGQLRSREWTVARRAAERLATMPELAALIRRLGRSEPRPGTRPSPAPPRAEPPRRRAPVRAIETRIPGAPGELTGIRFDHRLDGMLASEAALLHHPLGRRLWRARWAEGRLLSHDTAAVLVDRRPDPSASPAPVPLRAEPQSLAHGPIVLCLDTSGSMRGAPENIAKAVAIAAVREAHASRRACKVIAFGGPGELVERDLGGPDADGLGPLLALMGQAFDGGTDIQTPIERAIERVHETAWRSADLLIVSDGEFGCVRATLDAIARARDELGLRVQGVLVGDRETMGLLEVCDDIHWVRDWRRQSDKAAADPRASAAPGWSPVHSKSLTALYFPNALSPYAARHHGPSPATGGGLIAPAPAPASPTPPARPR